jgi:hypothetical protein
VTVGAQQIFIECDEARRWRSGRIGLVTIPGTMPQADIKRAFGPKLTAMPQSLGTGSPTISLAHGRTGVNRDNGERELQTTSPSSTGNPWLTAESEYPAMARAFHGISVFSVASCSISEYSLLREPGINKQNDMNPREFFIPQPTTGVPTRDAGEQLVKGVHPG